MKKILFLSGTRADYGKLKSLIKVVDSSSEFELFLFVTGMHLEKKYGYTIQEIENSNYGKAIFPFINKSYDGRMDITLSNTIKGLSDFVINNSIDLIVIHGDRPETLAGAIVGSFNNILVAHIEGGEVSGTIDEMIRHSTSKLSHFHFVSNQKARERLIGLKENPDNIVVMGNPDLDVILDGSLPLINDVKKRYDIKFDDFAIVLFHPVTTAKNFENKVNEFIEGILSINENLIIIYPNNDFGSEYIINQYEKILKPKKQFKLFPSLRFEYYLTLLKNSKFIIGNSSSGIHEAPYFSIPAINIGDRQNLRSNSKHLINAGYSKKDIIDAYFKFLKNEYKFDTLEFGNGNSSSIFFQTLKKDTFWKTNPQKFLNEA
jgi:UDP-N-acetylglucosamine 2-epimerase (hydrolysing)